MILTNSQTNGAIASQIRFTRKKSIYAIEALLNIAKVSPESGEETLTSEFGKFCINEKQECIGNRQPGTYCDDI